MEDQQGPQEDVALGMEVSKETRSLEDMIQNLKGDDVTIGKWKEWLSK